MNDFDLETNILFEKKKITIIPIVGFSGDTTTKMFQKLYESN